MVYPWTHPTTGQKRWRYAYRDPAGAWRYRTHQTREAAIEGAQDHLRTTGEGVLDFQTLPKSRRAWLEKIHLACTTPDEERALEDFIQARRKSSSLADAVARYIAGKVESAGVETPHIGAMRRDLVSLAEKFPNRFVTEIHLPDLEAWANERGANAKAKRRNGIRAAATGFWRWAQREGIAGADPVPLAARLTSPHVPATELRILTPDELRAIAREIRPEYRAWLALGAFAGMRSEEIVPLKAKRSDRRGLLCEEIDWDFRVLRIPACVSKVKRARIVPMSDALIDSLKWAGIEPGATGPVCAHHPHQTREMARLGTLCFPGDGWPQNAIRHTFGTARNAILRNLPQVAEEMGTSVSMLQRHYHNPQPKEFGEAWFVIRFDPMETQKTRKISQKAFSQSLIYQRKRA